MNRPLSLYPQKPDERQSNWIAQVGTTTVGSYRFTWRLMSTLGQALASLTEPGKAAAHVSWRIALRQVFFTGFQALPLISAIASLVGATIILQINTMAASVPGEVSGRILVALVLRELAPLVTAVVVAGRSGTAIATELGNMRANFEVLGLASLGINPMRFIVMPRLIASVVAVLVLTVYFGAIAILGGCLVTLGLDGTGLDSLRAGFAEAVTLYDLPLFVIKGIGLGTIVGWLSCHFGLEVKGSPTEVPQMASQAVVMSLLACVIYNTLCTAGFYWIVGPTIR